MESNQSEEKNWDELTEDSERVVRLSKFQTAMIVFSLLLVFLAIVFRFYLGYFGVVFLIAALRSFFMVDKKTTAGQKRRINYAHNYEDDEER